MRFLPALLCLTAVAYAQTSAPTITGATPGAVDAGGAAFTITVNLSSFISGAKVKWSGTELETQYVNDTTLTATVPPGLTAICGRYPLTVANAQVASNSFPVIVKPVLNAISPSSLPAGTNGTGVTAVGLGFSSNVYLTLIASGTRTNLPTQTSPQGSTTTLTAFVPASALEGTFPKAELLVTDPSTNAVSQTLPITLTYASISAINPNQIKAGIDTFFLFVSGANFVQGAVVLFNGAPLTTAYGSATLLRATVPAGLVHDDVPGGVGIQVKNPGTAATNSIKLVIDPNPFGTQLISLSPDHAIAGGPGLTVTVTGDRFVNGSTVNWVRTPLPTTFVSATQLTFTVPVDLAAFEGVAPITVVTPGLANSNSVNFPIVAVAPTISTKGDGISPTTAVAGSPGFTMTVNGDGFILTSQLTGFTGATTTYVSLNQLKVNVPASAIAVPGPYVLRVQSPGAAPGAPPLLSPQAPVFTVTAPGPAITGLTPASVLVGGPEFTLTVNGSNFVPTATVNWNGQPLVTKSVSTTQLTAQVPATLIASAGTAKITVVNDASAASNELPLPISSSLVPTLSSLSPSSTTPGGAAFNLTVNGVGFTSNTTVQWNGTTLEPDRARAGEPGGRRGDGERLRHQRKRRVHTAGLFDCARASCHIDRRNRECCEFPARDCARCADHDLRHESSDRRRAIRQDSAAYVARREFGHHQRRQNTAAVRQSRTDQRAATLRDQAGHGETHCTGGGRFEHSGGSASGRDRAGRLHATADHARLGAQSGRRRTQWGANSRAARRVRHGIPHGTRRCEPRRPHR
jgi:hypothetical protein